MVSKKNNKNLLIALGLFAGGLLIIISFFVPGGGNGGEKSGNTGIRSDLSRTDTSAYAAEHERKLRELLGRIDGVSEPFVMITLESSSEYIYATKQSIKESVSKNGETSQRDVQRELILYEDEKKAKSPVLVKEIKPKIKGVAVVCRGISGEDIRLKIINLVSAALNLPADKVYVVSAD
ncbi:MAG: hypothetical protein FWH10_07080 [Oscillospiraceae bacterium]|nr:hypothetical protein [Oscillospiraceae bacterium]